MLKRVLLIGSAFLLAGVILLVTMRADSGDPAIPTHQTQLVPQPTTPPPFSAENTGVDPRRTPEADIEGLLFTRSNERDQLIQIFAKRSRPKPQGVHEVEWPGAQDYLTPYRLLEIRAIHGMFLAPDNQPRSGQFQGRVVLTLYESAPDRILDVSPDSPDIRLRLFLEDTRFDLELGTIDSDGPVHLTSPRVDFLGTGLHLTYNEARSRLEHLVIDQGQLLRIATAAPPGPSRGANRVTGTSPSPSAAAAAPPPTFYRAIFDRQVHIAAKDETIDADQLEAIFALAGSGQDQVMHGLGQSPPPQVAGGPATQPASNAATRPAPQPQAASQAADAPLPDDVSMLSADQNALNITWAGPLNVEPDENPPAELHGPDESLLQLDGRPVKITTTRQETIVGARVDYLTSGGRINVEGSDDFPMVIDLGNMGILRGPSLVIDQSSGKGWIPGPGTLRARTNRPDVLNAIDPTAPPANSASGLPSGTVVSWGTRMDLAFYLRDRHGAGAAGASTAAPRGLADFGSSSGIRGIKTIMLTGDVDIHHPKFSLQSDQLTLALDDSEQGKQTLKQVLAQGNVHSASEGDSDQPPMHLDSDQLTVDLARDRGGSMNPTDLHALGHVHATQAGQVIDAGQLDVGLESVRGRGPAKGLTRGSSPPAGTKDNQGWHLALRTVHAQDNVDIQLQKPPVRITGDRADRNLAPESGQAQLLQIHGSVNHPAQFVRDDGSSLTGQDVFWSPATQKGYVPGPGKLVFFSTAPLRPSAGQPARPVKPAIPNKVTITWQGSMHFDNVLGSADFVEGVEVQSVMGRETADLTSDVLHADFVSQTVAGKAAGPGKDVAPLAEMAKPAPKTNADANPLGRGGRVIRIAAAHGHVFFHAESWPETTPGQFATRLSLDGDLMTFDNLAQQVQVIGPGHMLMEDYRPAESHHPIAASASPQAATKPAALSVATGSGPIESNASPRTLPASQPSGDDTNPVVHFSGRGKTLFTWTGQLTLDATHNDMLIEQDVQMVHVPTDGSDRVQLDCQRFEAATASSGGMGAWLSDKAPQAGIESVLADHDVTVMTQHRIIRTDHLEYQGATQIITFRADLGRVTEVTEADGANPETFQNGQMDLRKDRIEINEPGRQVEPMDRRQN